MIFWGPLGYWKESPLHRLDLLLVAVAAIGTVLEVAGAVDKHVSMLMNFLRCGTGVIVLLPLNHSCKTHNILQSDGFYGLTDLSVWCESSERYLGLT